MSDRPKVLVVVSDLHCGSSVGLCPPDFKTKYGNAVGFGDNIHQAWLWDKWQEAFEEVDAILGNDNFCLCVNGDATEGIHHRSTEIVATLIEDHCRMAAEALKPYAQAASEIFIVKGTECHTGEIESYLASLLSAREGIAKDKWLFSINGCLVDACHHMGVTSRAYLEASAMSIVLGNARLNAVRSGHPAAKVFLRGHRHCGGWFSDGDAMLAVTGGWQFLTRHGNKVVPDSVPRPSVLVLDWRKKREGELPEVRHITFAPPAPEIVHV